MSRAAPVIVGAREGGGGDAVPPPAISTAADAIPSAGGTISCAASPSSPTAPGSVDSRTGRLFPVRKHARLTAEYWNAVLRRLETTPPKIVAYEMGVSWESLRMRLSRAGAKPRLNGEGLPPRLAQIVAMRRDGATYNEIAAALGIQSTTVKERLSRARKRGVAV